VFLFFSRYETSFAAVENLNVLQVPQGELKDHPGRFTRFTTPRKIGKFISGAAATARCCVNVHKVKSQEETGSFPRHITGTKKKPQIPHSWLLTTENRVVRFYCSDTAMTVDQGRAKIHGAVSKGVARVHHLTPEAGHH
jgi:hypothetical protein